MNNLIDVVCSFLLGGIVIALLQGLMVNMTSTAGEQTFETIVQSNLTTAADMVTSDFRRMGYGAPGAADSAILYADPQKIVFQGDLDNDGIFPDSLSYMLGDVRPAANTNPRTRYLFRRWRNQPPQPLNLGLTKFTLTYYDGAGNELPAVPRVAAPGSIRSVRIGIVVESISPWNGRVASASWEQVLKPLNLR